MRKITREATRAFWNEKSFRSSNTEVKVTRTDDLTITRMYLHGNMIAERTRWENFSPTHPDRLRLTLAGWGTPTTRERLNGIIDTAPRHIEGGWYQRKHEQYFGDERLNPLDLVLLDGQPGRYERLGIVPLDRAIRG